MKRLTLALVAAPGAALAHGGHIPLPELSHGVAHALPAALIALVAVAGVAVWRTRRR
jgi:MYXO-CTERM domain-containing protein